MSQQTPLTPNLHVHFSFLRDEREHDGVVAEYTPEGVIFLTHHEASVGQEIMVAVCLVEEHSEHCSLKRPAKICAVRERKSAYAISAVFVPETHEAENRREATRYPVRMKGTCTSPKSGHQCNCSVTDISRNGLCLITNRHYAEDAELHVVAAPEKEKTGGSSLDALVTVTRSRHIGGGRYEIGTAFQVVKVGEDSTQPEAEAAEDSAGEGEPAADDPPSAEQEPPADG